MGTADKAKSMYDGDSLYQKRAREAFPILVGMAYARRPITYKALGDLIGMKHHKPLNFVLASIGKTLIEASKELAYKEEIPMIQSLVVNQQDGLPGGGIGGFDKSINYEEKSPKEKKFYVKVWQQKVYSFSKWDEVLRHLKLEPRKVDTSGYISEIGMRRSSEGGSGESEEHRKLKEFILANPEKIGLKKKTKKAKAEYKLLSGDSIDVFFQFDSNLEVAVEIKSVRSDENDIIRGFFQSVKYREVLRAQQVTEFRPQNVHSILVVQTKLSPKLIELGLLLGIEVKVCIES